MDESLFQDDSGGESFGFGLDNSALGLSGADALNVDFLGETPLQGGDVSLDWTDGETFGGGVADLPLKTGGPDYWDDLSLSGVSDSPPSWDASGPSLNGSGTALAMTHGSIPYSEPSSISNLLGMANKFGASFSTLFHGSPSPATAGGVPRNANPNFARPSSITGSHAAVLVGVAVVLVAALAFGGSR